MKIQKLEKESSLTQTNDIMTDYWKQRQNIRVHKRVSLQNRNNWQGPSIISDIGRGKKPRIEMVIPCLLW